MGWTSICQLFWSSLGTRVLTHPQISFFDKTVAIVGPLLLMLNHGMNGNSGLVVNYWANGTVEHGALKVLLSIQEFWLGIWGGWLIWVNRAHLDGCSTVEIDLFDMDLVLQQCCTDFPQKLCGIMWYIIVCIYSIYNRICIYNYSCIYVYIYMSTLVYIFNWF